MASATFVPSSHALLRNPTRLSRPPPRLLSSRSSLLHRHSRNPSPLPTPLKLTTPKASAAPILPTPPPPLAVVISDSTRTISSLLVQALSLARVLAASAHSLARKIGSAPTVEEVAKIQSLKGSLACAIGPLFFATLRDRPSGYLNTPLTVVAAGMSRWLDIYSGVLMVRVLLSWFPNIPWDRQPLSAIRDLCDPYLNLFRNIIPPIFDTLDVSPLLAFAVLGTLGSILNNSRGMY